MRSSRSTVIPVALLTLLFLLSCGKDTTAPDEKTSGTGPVTKTITPDGGGVTARAEDGTAIHVTFPPGAVSAPTRVTVRPLAPSGGAWFRASLEPAGLVLRQPFDLTITATKDQAISGQQLYFGDPADPVYLATERNGNTRTLTGHLWSFGLPIDNVAFARGAKAAPMSGSAGSTNNQVGAIPATCQQIHNQAIAAYNALVNSDQYNDALQAALGAAAALQVANCPGVEGWITLAKELACNRLDAAISDAQKTPIGAYGDFEAQVKPILNWVAENMALDSGCAALDTYPAVLTAKAQEFSTWHVSQVNQLTTPDFPTFVKLKQELVKVYDVLAAARSMGIEAGADQIEAEAIPASANAMRAIAYTLGNKDHWHYALTKLTTRGFFAGRDIIGVPDPRTCDDTYTPPRCFTPPNQWAPYTDDDIYNDIQYCATELSVQGDAVSGGVLDVQPAGGEGSPGKQTDAVTVLCPTRGTIEIGGTIWGLTCYLTGEKADDQVVVSLDGKNVLTLLRPTGDEYLEGTPAQIPIAEAAAEAGITPSEGTTSELKVVRHRPNCDDGLWGATDFTLVTATLVWKNPTLKTTITFPDSVASGSSTTAQVKVDVTDQFGVSAPAADTDVHVGVTGGSATTPDGKTDANGVFTTPVVAGVARNSAAYAPSGAGSMTIDATATSFEGVTAEASKQASVHVCPAQGYEHSVSTKGIGDFTIDADYGHCAGTATAAPGGFSDAKPEWIDSYVVEVNDPALDGQNGFIYVKLHYRFTSDGSSTYTPTARVSIGPRNGVNSPFFYTINYNSGPAVENDWEVPITCTFNRVGPVLDVRADVFAAAPADAGVTVTASLVWMGISKVTTAGGTPVTDYSICTASGTDYSGALGAAPSPGAGR